MTRYRIRRYALTMLLGTGACAGASSGPRASVPPAPQGARSSPTTDGSTALTTLMAAPTRSRPVIPAQLSDAEFWRLITEVSEPGGYFRSENFVSNEMGLQYVLTQLRDVVPPSSVYLGVGPEQNFTYLAALNPRIAFIVDIRRQNLLQHLWYKAVFELSPTRAAFLTRLFARQLPLSTNADLSADSLIVLLDAAPADPALFRRTFAEVRAQLVITHGFTLDSADLATLRYVDSVFFASGPTLNYSSGGGGGFGGGRGFGRMPTFAQIAGTTDEAGVNRGFLGNEVQYAVVRNLQRRNLVIPIVGNFSGPTALRAVGQWLRDRDATVNVMYTSNVEQYLFGQGDDWSRFYANVESMPLDSNSTFIRSITSRGGFGFSGPGAAQVNNLMTQLTSPMLSLVRDARLGTIRSYYDVIGRSR